MTAERFTAKKEYYIRKYGKKEGLAKFNEFMKKLKKTNKKMITKRKPISDKPHTSTNISKSFRFLFF